MMTILPILKDVLPLAVSLVERPGDGEAKKEEVKEIVFSLFDDFGIDLPFDDDIFEHILDRAIDFIVDFFNIRVWNNA
ncbi:hypothetical protein [Thermotoga neapolitana]|uniref:Uncharacterized protein n=1 Tax=Thermotoga neapolitana (strain ATCC 49049 / DSM 4359 / NBRC 107923 / NS-E) TaxID=309803 RepID=B9KB02_THENN|nr:hypothetical protein [Thermotoga neapolitana]ACM22198.1 Putative uncharacterized protein [Thermotoga neapolitana DSM 4359]KFZ20922.1 hypothetical protein LA10_10414 [Thermotoga neapolitana LA10]HBF10794.1 hypothetical protein [Thermotoga neapolitana]